MLTFGSLFAGIGGFDLGFERAGMKCVWQVEIDEYARAVLKKHWPDARQYADIREVAELDYVDIVAGGFPCQDISKSGKGAGLDGARSSLWFEMLRIIREVRPRYVVVENVSALYVRGINRVLAGLAEVGYDAEWVCIRASAFGAWHMRNRAFIVAYPYGWGLQEPPAKLEESRETYADFIVPQNWGDIRKNFWENPGAIESAVCGINDGFSFRMDRVRCLGNAVVPQIAQYIGKKIIEAEGRLNGNTA